MITIRIFIAGLALALALPAGAQLRTSGSGIANPAFIHEGSGAVARSFLQRDREVWLSVTDFGAKCDGATDDTTAFRNAVSAAEARNGQNVRVPIGTCRITDTITMHRGIALIGEVGPTNNAARGTVIAFEPSANNLPLFLWDGGGAAGYTPTNSGVGGGLQNMLLLKNNAASGAEAIKLLAIDDNHRPGEIIFRDVVIANYDSTAFEWQRGLHVDGTAAATAGSKGVRSIRLEKFRVASCSQDNEYILLDQAVHVSADHLQIDTSVGTGVAGMTIQGDSDNIMLNGLIINGNLVIGGSSAMNVVLSGRAAALDVNNSSVIGAAMIEAATSVNNAAKNFSVISNLAPAFLGRKTTSTTNATGDNTAYTVVYDGEAFDRSSAFNPATGIYTANVAGLHEFRAVIAFGGLGSAHTRSDSALIHKSSGGAVLGVYSAVVNPFASGSNSGANFAQQLHALVEMAEGDTMQVVAQVSGGTKTVTVRGAAVTSGDYTFFAGKLIP